MKIRNGQEEITIHGERKKSIIEFDFENYTLFVFQGTISAFDILIKYRKDGLRIRTPKHIHWAVDMLIKMQREQKLASDFLNEAKKIWINCKPLKSNDFDTLKNLVENCNIDVDKYKKLNSYGEYPVDFLFVLMLLLSTQEKTNRADAYMFGNIIDELLESDYDIFKIVSTAGYNGRR
ncbi:MAG: hypothetical protein K2K80_06265 [Clostridia bacterium]|nr:hypothetical protein [Clostridia bacterium]